MSSEMSAPLFGQLILAAPDIHRDVFERDIAPAIVKTAQRTTLYASSQDVALRFSATVRSYARAGQSLQPLIYVRGLGYRALGRPADHRLRPKTAATGAGEVLGVG